ncbi:glycosyltransferase family 2 protein [Ectopseudomonas oleovorans]|uniref:Glycosyl transferase family 2 n=1 Tax=Ectopseudomonas chengduensis TaxID=489632 RepID=A0A1G6PE10_9GAMM|nr:glycosyltransferase family A protein [Pseudomonas chengduensis]MBP3060774.1 glycosyltransferase [Pseudomonas chengduensis]NNB73635.1 glycosyltransferase family 2 protein [Pseudomonas chengduensis]SDC78258.1 Glycosyl transferase family 2 [Pseudomonas chengduensis]
MKKFEPYVYVLIPVKDRAQYLFHTLRTCEIQTYNNLRVIVSDDGSSDNTRQVVEAAHSRDSRISYVSPGSNVGMKRNFEFALDHAVQGYVMFLGGDDGLMPGAIERLVQRIDETQVDLITWNPPIYTYPGANSIFGKIKLTRRTQGRYVDSREYLLRQAKVLNYIADEETPMIYVKGAVSVNLISRVRRRSPSGEFYQSPTPDGYSGIVLAGEVTRFWFEDNPITIYGVSPSSQGMAYLSKDEAAKRQSEDFFNKASDNKMANELASQPYSPLISLMTADYLLTASKLQNWPGHFEGIDYTDLLSKSLDELANGLYSTDRIAREIRILINIAKQHGLSDYINKLIDSKWKYIERSDFDGDGANLNAVFIGCNDTFIKNILDAAYFVQSTALLRNKLKVKEIINGIVSSLRYKISARKRLCRMNKYVSELK